MCNGGSSNPIKDPLYWLVKQDSRAAAELGRAIGWDGLRDEGKYNQKNPGHAITKAGEYALAAYLGGVLGGGGDAAAGGAEAGAGAGLSAGGEGVAEELAAQQAAQMAAQQVPQGLANTMESGLTDTGYTPSFLWHALNNSGATATSAANRALGTSASQTGLLGNLTSGGSGTAGNKALMAQQGLKMMFPEQPQQRAAPSQPFQGQQGPLPTMYERSGPYGTSAGNSLGFTEEQKRKLRELGYKI